MRSWLGTATNALLGSFGLRMVNARWGPRGAMDSLRRARSQGVVPRQIVDVRVSNGSWTRECLSVFPEARYLLVEPQPEHEPALAALRARHANVRTWQGALGSSAGSLDLLVHGDQSSFLPSDSLAAGRTRQVEVRPLDSFLGSELLQPPDLVKADVQGFELEVLRGAGKCLATAQLLLLEVCYRRIYRNLPLAHELIAYAGNAGFRIYDLCTYAGRPSDGELTYSDILFAREGSPLFADESWC
jgi:FkbM family methyltransferase